jgi:hypothetical protein
MYSCFLLCQGRLYACLGILPLVWVSTRAYTKYVSTTSLMRLDHVGLIRPWRFSLRMTWGITISRANKKASTYQALIRTLMTLMTGSHKRANVTVCNNGHKWRRLIRGVSHCGGDCHRVGVENFKCNRLDPGQSQFTILWWSSCCGGWFLWLLWLELPVSVWLTSMPLATAFVIQSWDDWWFVPFAWILIEPTSSA